MKIKLKINENFISAAGVLKIRNVVKCDNIISCTFIESVIFCVYFNESEYDFYNYGLVARPISSTNPAAPPNLSLIFTTDAGIDNRKGKKAILNKLKKHIENFDYEGLKQAINVAKKVIEVLEGKHD